MDQNVHEIDQTLNCKNCGASLNFKPGTHSLVCGHCSAVNEIVSEDDDDDGMPSYDFNGFIQEKSSYTNTVEATTVKCKGCGATTSMAANLTADKCPFCASPLVLDINNSERLVKPHYILPFVIDKDAANGNFKKWLGSLWFAPFGLAKKITETSSALTGVYLPHWTYDADTETSYTGQRGDYYYVTETYTEVVDGEEQVREREVRRTNWYWVNGIVDCDFENVMISATGSLSNKSDDALKPWDINKLVHFDERYLSGFRAETYQLEPEDGLAIAKKMMDPTIRQAIMNDIGGDEQMIDSHESQYNNVGIKYILLPVWISSYSYNSKIYQFIVNANTGLVTGERPTSWLKIAICIIIALIIISIFVLDFMGAKAN